MAGDIAAAAITATIQTVQAIGELGPEEFERLRAALSEVSADVPLRRNVFQFTAAKLRTVLQPSVPKGVSFTALLTALDERGPVHGAIRKHQFPTAAVERFDLLTAENASWIQRVRRASVTPYDWVTLEVTPILYEVSIDRGLPLVVVEIMRVDEEILTLEMPVSSMVNLAAQLVREVTELPDAFLSDVSSRAAELREVSEGLVAAIEGARLAQLRGDSDRGDE